MSTAVLIACDVKGCPNWSGADRTATEARRKARTRGWTRGLGGDYCPDHRAAAEVGPDRYAEARR